MKYLLALACVFLVSAQSIGNTVSVTAPERPTFTFVDANLIPHTIALDAGSSDYVTHSSTVIGKPDITIGPYKSGGVDVSAHFYQGGNETYPAFLSRVKAAKVALLEAFPKD